MSMSNDAFARPSAVLFDMDGTLTEPMLDFPRIKSEMGIGQEPILEAMAAMDAQAREAAERILFRHEEHAARQARLNPGCRELLDWLVERDIAVALITRNSRQSARTVVQLHQLPIDVLITREDAAPKPHPAPLRLACSRLEIKASATMMVGDGEFDIEAAGAAGIRSVWLSHARERAFSAIPDVVVPDLYCLLQLLSSM